MATGRSRPAAPSSRRRCTAAMPERRSRRCWLPGPSRVRWTTRRRPPDASPARRSRSRDPRAVRGVQGSRATRLMVVARGRVLPRGLRLYLPVWRDDAGCGKRTRGNPSHALRSRHGGRRRLEGVELSDLRLGNQWRPDHQPLGEPRTGPSSRRQPLRDAGCVFHHLRRGRKVLLAVRSLRHGAPDAALRRARGGGPARPEAENRLGHPDEASADRHASARVAAGLRHGRFVPRSASHREDFMTEQLFPAGAVLVVGGSGGVGQAVCLEFARAGSDVALTYHSKRDNAEKVAEKIRALGRKVSVHQLTIGDAAQVDTVVAAAAKEHGRLHTVVVGAGTLAEQVLISEMSRKQWQTVIDQDLNGFFNVVQATLLRLREWGGGSYVHLGSAGHLQWPPRDVMSVAPKAAIEALITGIAKEEGRYNIRANTVLLGVIEAGMFLELTKQGVFDAKWVEEVQNNLALKRWGKPEEIGYAAVFLASSRAGYVTGLRIPVAGGFGL